MNLTLRQVGNSDGLILPKEVMKFYNLKRGDTLELKMEQGHMVLKVATTDISKQLEAARIGMRKYKVALNELAK